jgi:hypothetical protein
LGFWVELLLSVEIPGGFDLYFMCIILGLVLMIPGTLWQKFVVTGENKE